jgi:PiT family inorganic phosphate transporter
MINPSIFSGGLLGWSLGSNDAANVFGTAVTTKIVKYNIAIILTSVFIIAGALISGHNGVHKLSDYAYSSGVNTSLAAFLVMLSAAITVTGMTVLKLPVSTSQAVIGSIIGAGLVTGNVDFKPAVGFLSAWIITPFGAMLTGFILYKLFEKFLSGRIENYFAYGFIIKAGYYLAGIFAAYSLGANNVANVTSIYSGKLNLISTNQAVLIGGISIALGVLTFSKRVMYTVGSGIVNLSPVAGFISVLSAAIVVYIYSLIGIPVSTSQAIVGAVVGIGLVKGIANINLKMFKNILFAWFGTPTIAAVLSFILIFVL